MSDPTAYRFTKPLAVYADDPLGYAARLEFSAGEVEALPVRADGSRRFVCTVEREPPWHVALIPDGVGNYFIIVNKERLARWREAGYAFAQLSLKLTPDDSEYGMPMPDELGELLLMDEEGSRYFHDLTPGKQRALIYQVAKPKREATRLRKAVGIIDYLKSVRGVLDFRELNAFLRDR